MSCIFYQINNFHFAPQKRKKKQGIQFWTDMWVNKWWHRNDTFLFLFCSATILNEDFWDKFCLVRGERRSLRRQETLNQCPCRSATTQNTSWSSSTGLIWTHSHCPPLGVSLRSLIAVHTEESIKEVIWLGWNNIPPLPNRRQFLISSLRFYIRKRNFLHLSCDPMNHKIRLRNIMPPTQ